MRAEIISTIDDVEPDAWNALDGAQGPFNRHEFLAALESAGCVGEGTGWNPCHVTLYEDDGRLVGAIPLYRKLNSWGEFVFDFAWADAYHRAGLHYYPKLVSAIPYTPATGARCLISPVAADSDRIMRALLSAALKAVETTEASSLHFLFPSPRESKFLKEAGFLLRKDCQFHWHNKDYNCFDDFLGEMTSVKRKKLKRERRRIREAGIQFQILTGHELDGPTWQKIMPLYSSSFWRRGREPYLNQRFFQTISEKIPEHIVVILAVLDEEAIATAICFRNADTLYGRYWGSSGRYHSLHFETCYYQGIDYCIKNGLAYFEPGTQGEHKISRGFVPTETWSAHWLSHPQFAAAVDEYLGRERTHIDEYIDAVQEHVPFRKHAP